jgi:hypothetical protein
MKSKLLPISLLVLVLGFTTIILTSGWINNQAVKLTTQDNSSIKNAEEYLHKMRANQITGKIDPKDVLNARQQAITKEFKSGNELGLNWEEMGPDNAPGRVRAVIFDNRDASGQTVIAAGVSGGIWKTTNLGATWNKINQENKNLYITSMTQADDGTIYAGTGESFCTEDDTYHGGLVGDGMYVSTDGDNFTKIESTSPVVTQDSDTVDWAYINNIVISPATQRIYAATNTGLFFTENTDVWQKAGEFHYDSVSYNVEMVIDSVVYCDSWERVGDNFIINNPNYEDPDTLSYEKNVEGVIANIMPLGKMTCTDVSVSSDGLVVATFDNMVFTATEAMMKFRNRSSNPNNPYEKEREFRVYETTLTVIDTLNESDSRTITFEETTDWANAVIDTPSPLSLNPGRCEVEVAPSDPNIVYATCTSQFGYLDNVYFSEDKGETWIIIFPGASTSEIFNGTGCYNNTLAVFPNDAQMILVGGINMWQGKRYENTNGYFDWGAGAISSAFVLPTGHHKYVFKPGSSSKFIAATNKGISLVSLKTSGNEFQWLGRGLNITQCYTVGPSGNPHELLCGAQGDGTQYISGQGNTPEYAEQIFAGTGGYCAISMIDPNAFIYSQEPGVIVRSEDKGENTSFNFNAPGSNIFLTPLFMWESFEDEFSRDSVKFYADQDYAAGDVVLCRSANYEHPFDHLLTENLSNGDSLMVKDIIQNKLFIANAGAVQMTKGAIKFDQPGNFWKIANTPGFPSTIAVSKDANFVFVGTDDGKLYRISNIALAYDSLRADIGSSACIISTNELQIPQFDDRFITSVAIDQQNPEHVIVTLGNYGNEDYVYRTTNALDSLSLVVFEDITFDLPKMPVYSSVIEMKESNKAIIGTEYGIYTTSNLGDDVVIWTKENSEMGSIPVFQIKQQTVFKRQIEVPTVPPVVYPEIFTYGSLYIATYGRGVFMDETFRTVGIDELEQNNTAYSINNVSVYPNPVASYATVSMDITAKTDVMVKVYDLTGKLVSTTNAGELSSGKQEVNIDCSMLQAGTFILKVFAGDDSGTSKFIVN